MSTCYVSAWAITLAIVPQPYPVVLHYAAELRCQFRPTFVSYTHHIFVSAAQIRFLAGGATRRGVGTRNVIVSHAGSPRRWLASGPQG